MLTTRRKKQLAKVASLGLRAVRSLVGLESTTRASRGGINWELDLVEGIDLAIYLGSYQSIGRHVQVNVLRPGAAVIDVGANIGAFTLPFAAALGEQGRVIAIEATDFAFQKLGRNLALNPRLASRVTALQAVLDSPDGREEASGGIYSSWRLDRAFGSLRHPYHGGLKMSTNRAVTVTLDSLLGSDPHLASIAGSVSLIKLDVDGNELSVLRGAHAILKSARPSILIEIAPYVQNEKAGGLAKLVGEIQRLGYKLEDACSGRPIRCSAEELNRLIPDGAGMDVLCSPA